MTQYLELKLEHTCNPLHVFCRLVGVGIGKTLARSISQLYEKALFNKAMAKVKNGNREKGKLK